MFALSKTVTPPSVEPVKCTLVDIDDGLVEHARLSYEAHLAAKPVTGERAMRTVRRSRVRTNTRSGSKGERS